LTKISQKYNTSTDAIVSYIRQFSEACRSINEFESFVSAIDKVIDSDPLFIGTAHISQDTKAKSPDFEKVELSNISLPILTDEGINGFLEYKSRRDGRAFGAGDLYLLGALSDFVSVLVAKADNFRKSQQASKILFYLVDQLPLGVVCFALDGKLIVQNDLAKKALGTEGQKLLSEQLNTLTNLKDKQIRLHFEVDQRFLYSEGRILKIDDETSVATFVLYDLSPSRDQLLLSLEHTILMAENQSENLVVALMRDTSQAGRMHNYLKEHCPNLGLKSDDLKTVDAYSCVCIFENSSLAQIRAKLGKNLAQVKSDHLKLSLVESRLRPEHREFAEQILASAEASIDTLANTLKPVIAVVDTHAQVFDSLELFVGEQYRLLVVSDCDRAFEYLKNEQCELSIVDLDSLSINEVATIDPKQMARTLWTSYRQTFVVRELYQMPKNARIIQKPFDHKIVDSLVKNMIIYRDDV
jgi:PAS domain-containing protein